MRATSIGGVLNKVLELIYVESVERSKARFAHFLRARRTTGDGRGEWPAAGFTDAAVPTSPQEVRC